MTAPFVKYAGGKTQLLGEILPRLPAKIETYFEPFVGGGAVFFALAEAGRFRRAVLGDKDEDLVEIYRAVRDDVERLIRVLRWHKRQHCKGYFYWMRDDVEPAKLDPTQRAARSLYLNRTCFNGLWRKNRSGRFNAPFGRYAKPLILDPDRLRADARALRSAYIVCADFEVVASGASAGDAVYFDPPYLPLDESSFVSYGVERFSAFDHQRLADVYRDLLGRHVPAVISSSSARAARRIYAGLEVVEVKARRSINASAKRRGAIGELLIVGGAR